MRSIFDVKSFTLGACCRAVRWKGRMEPSGGFRTPGTHGRCWGGVSKLLEVFIKKKPEATMRGPFVPPTPFLDSKDVLRIDFFSIPWGDAVVVRPK